MTTNISDVIVNDFSNPAVNYNLNNKFSAAADTSNNDVPKVSALIEINPSDDINKPKLFYVVKNSTCKLRLRDLRENSATFGNITTLYLSNEVPKTIKLPHGIQYYCQNSGNVPMTLFCAEDDFPIDFSFESAVDLVPGEYLTSQT